MSIFSREKLSRWRLSKLFFYIFLFALPFQTGKGLFTDKSFYLDYLSFYNTWHLYLTDLLFLCVIIVWVLEKGLFSCLPTGQAGEKVLNGGPSTLLGASQKKLPEKDLHYPKYLFFFPFFSF